VFLGVRVRISLSRGFGIVFVLFLVLVAFNYLSCAVAKLLDRLSREVDSSVLRRRSRQSMSATSFDSVKAQPVTLKTRLLLWRRFLFDNDDDDDVKG